jgi:hypothetical protein
MLPLCQNGEYWRADKRSQDRENRRCGRLGATVSTTEIPGRMAIFQHMAHPIYTPNRPHTHSAFFRDLCRFFATCDEQGGTTPLVSPRQVGVRLWFWLGYSLGVRSGCIVPMSSVRVLPDGESLGFAPRTSVPLSGFDYRRFGPYPVVVHHLYP